MDLRDYFFESVFACHRCFQRVLSEPVYIVYMGPVQDEYSVSPNYHHNILQQVLNSSNAEESLVRSYRRSFNGFAAKMTQNESEKLKRMEGVVSVFPSRMLELQTTRSWDFMGFPESSHTNLSSQSDIIIGVIDSGISPDSPSFKDDGLSPPPKKWRGVCHGGHNFTCNNKLIGVRVYGHFQTGKDEIGHGTHTASTASGQLVPHTSFYGLAEGTARGGAPSSRISAYKVCNDIGCDESGILAAFDDAISDGVDVISISIGGPAKDFKYDGIAIGAFHAMQKGILTVQSAGNRGNASQTVGSIAPWIFTVAASSMDRRIIDKVVLGDGKMLVGNSVNSFTLKNKKLKFPLVYGEDCTYYLCSETTRLQGLACLNQQVRGKIMVCGGPRGMHVGLQAGALGVIWHTDRTDNVSFVTPLPAVGLKSAEYDVVLSYLNSTKNPVANILKSEVTNDTSAPVVASFSSRGPSLYSTDILKPDITAPGVDILAAFSPLARPSSIPGDKRSVRFNILSGTSMACPHVAGAAAYVKSVHPDWSPSAIKSALMTTARPMSPLRNTDGEFAYGSGHLNPLSATNPGLVYETTTTDYTTFLCKLGYTDRDIQQITGNKTSMCPTQSRTVPTPKDTNYPTISAMVGTTKPFNLVFERTVTNVGVANSSYVAKVVTASKDLNVVVEPKLLEFKLLQERKSFVVRVAGPGLKGGEMVAGSLVWSDGVHSVRSPIVVYGNVD